MEPPDAQEHYTERLVRLPNLSIYYEPLQLPRVALSRAELGLRPTAMVYWCGQSLYKYLPQFDQVFARIACDAGDCQFVFFRHQEGTNVTESFKQRLERAFAALGLRADDYCVILPRMDFPKFLAVFGLSDIFLDSIRFSGGNTTLDSLPYGLPIVTMAAPLMRGRQSMAILKMMGVTETIAETLDEYVSVAIRLARDVAWRMAIRSKMSENRTRVFRDASCIAALEDFLDRAARRAST
jgi:predicted O-linked N-acetylglucosamine transferase (SPINDLY family)